jgi:hypothetical protein
VNYEKIKIKKRLTVSACPMYFKHFATTFTALLIFPTDVTGNWTIITPYPLFIRLFAGTFHKAYPYAGHLSHTLTKMRRVAAQSRVSSVGLLPRMRERAQVPIVLVLELARHDLIEKVGGESSSSIRSCREVGESQEKKFGRLLWQREEGLPEGK